MQISAVSPDSAPGARKDLAVWLFACCGMVFAMIVLGGVTRLTESGLSIVDWRPVTGILPPLSEAEWQALFERYKASPEFQRANFWMTLADFKGIYWLEYLHRLWGRVIGAAFLIPFVYFLIKRRIDRRLAPHLVLLFALGGAQGLLGWYMVQSGLVDEPTVSQYRLAAHLGLAVVIYGYMLWVALGLWHPGHAGPATGHRRALVALVWGFATLVSGAFVAGIDAGLAYNTFPLMDGRVVPPGMLTLSPWPINFFENTATVQFTHRVLAIALVVYLVALWLAARGDGLAPEPRRAFAMLAGVGFLQACLGVATLLSGVSLPLAAAHQAGAVLTLTAAIWTVFVTSGKGTSPAVD